MEEQVEADSEKECFQRYDHRAVMGVSTDRGRICPECFPLMVPAEASAPPPD